MTMDDGDDDDDSDDDDDDNGNDHDDDDNGDDHDDDDNGDLYIMVKCVCVCHEKVTKFVWPPPLFFQIFVAKFFFKYFLNLFL